MTGEMSEKTVEKANGCIFNGVRYLRFGVLFLLSSIFFITLQMALSQTPSVFISGNFFEAVTVFIVCLLALILPLSFWIRTFRPIEL